MKEVVDFLSSKGLVFKKLERFDLRVINVNKRVECFIGVDMKSYYHVIFISRQKSRFLNKNANELIDILEKIMKYRNHNIKHKILFINSICSKSKGYLTMQKWRVFIGSL